MPISAHLTKVRFDSSGNALAVWVQGDGTRYNVWSNRYLTGLGWGNAELIETENSGSAAGPKISIDRSGNALAVWPQYDGTRYNICSNYWVAP